jgi:hypothetical protein
MKKLYLLCLGLGSFFSAQTITFNGCHNIFDDQNFVFTKTGVDAYNKGIYITTPLDGQACGGLGSCEFKIQWNNTLSRWEFLADEGYGTFSSPNLIYYNSTGNNNFLQNPPAITFGTWIENTSFTSQAGGCGGNLTTSNSTMTGDLHSSSLATSDVRNNNYNIQIFPNPVDDVMKISGVKDGKSVQIYNMTGQIVKSEEFKEMINVSEISSGIYILKINTENFQTYEFKFVKK